MSHAKSRRLQFSAKVRDSLEMEENETFEETRAGRLSRRQFMQATAALSMVPHEAAQETGALGFPADLAQPPVYVTDLDRCQPRSALSHEPRTHRWRMLNYETENLKGVLLAAGQNTQAPEITCPLEQKGWHAIYIGLLSKHNKTRLQVRLSGDSTFSVITHTHQPEKAHETESTKFFGSLPI